jgi:hypothetical protein
MLLLRLQGHLDDIALTAAEVERLVEELTSLAALPPAERVAYLLEQQSGTDPVGFPLTDLENAALRHALDGIRVTDGDLSNGLALLHQEAHADD